MSEERSRRHGPEDGALDRAIDLAVRNMMSAEPRPGLPGRVLAQLETPARRAVLLPRLTFAAAALAAIVIAVLVLRPSPPAEPDGAQPVAVAGDVRPAPIETKSAEPPAAPRAAAARSARSAPTSTPIPMPRVTNVFGERNARVEPATAAVDDVVFPPSADPAPVEPPIAAPAPISIREITIAPLQVQLIRVDPLPVRK